MSGDKTSNQQKLLKDALLEVSSAAVSNPRAAASTIQHKRSNLVKESSDSTTSLTGNIKYNDLNIIEVIGGGGLKVFLNHSCLFLVGSDRHVCIMCCLPWAINPTNVMGDYIYNDGNHHCFQGLTLFCFSSNALLVESLLLLGVQAAAESTYESTMNTPMRQVLH
jgi:hypothetical protein